MPTHSPPSITVIVPVRNARAHLGRAITAVREQVLDGFQVDLLVVDNGSTDGSGDIARRLGARVLRVPQPGVARAREAGWRAAKTPFVAYLDADCEPGPDWLANAVKQFDDNPDLAAVGVRLVDAKATNIWEEHIAREHILDTDAFWRGSWLSEPFLVTAGLVLRRAALLSIGGFDLTFGRATGEDADLCWRLQDAGWKLIYDRTIEVIHHHRSSGRGMMKQAHWYGWGVAELFARHRDRFGLRTALDREPWKRLLDNSVRFLPTLIGRRSYPRVAPLLRILDGTAFLSGKIRGSLRAGVRCL